MLQHSWIAHISSTNLAGILSCINIINAIYCSVCSFFGCPSFRCFMAFFSKRAFVRLVTHESDQEYLLHFSLFPNIFHLWNQLSEIHRENSHKSYFGCFRGSGRWSKPLIPFPNVDKLFVLLTSSRGVDHHHVLHKAF